MLEIDLDHFEVIARSPSAVLTRNKHSGNLGLWLLEWRDRGNYPAQFEADAWEAYLKAQSNV